MNIPDLFHSADEIFDSVIVTQRLGIKQKIHKQFQNFYQNGIGPIPFVWTFEEALHQALPCPFQDWINSLLNDDVSIADCLAMLPCMEQALRLCQEYGNSFNVLPFQINEHSVLAQKAWKLIRGVLNSKEGKFSSSLWNKIEFLKTNFTKIIFVDSLPHVRTPCLNSLRQFIQLHHTFVQHNSCPSSVWITKFNSLKDEAIGIVRFVQDCDLSKRIAIVSDDYVLLQNVEAYLNDLNIPCRNKIEPSNFLDSTLGSFFLVFLNFLQNSCGATLEALLSHPFVQRIASQDFQQKSSKFLHSILWTESKSLGNRWIIKSEASLNDLQALASPDLSAWLSNLKWEEANIFKTLSFHLFEDYFYYHYKALLSFLNFINSDFKLELQYTFPVIKKPVSQNDYKTFLKFFMKQNFMTFKSDIFDFSDSFAQIPVLLLSSQQALSYDFDIVCLGSLSEQSWYQSSPFMLLLPIFDLSQEQDIFDYCLAEASQVFLSYHEGESLIPSHLLDKYKNYPSQNFPCTIVSFAAKKSLSAKADVPVPLRPRELSVTDLQNLKDDPYAFYAKKILHLYPLATLNNDLGCWTHFVLDQFIRQKAPSLPHFAQQLSQGSLTLFRYYVQMHNFFLRLEEEIENLEETKILTEQKITNAVSIAEHSFLLSGRIDRIDIHKESVTLIDYKTGTSSKTDIQNCVKLQLPLEAKLWKDQYDNDTKKILLHLISVKSQQTIIVPVDSDLLNKINKILSGLLTTYLQPDYIFETTINCKNRLRNYIHLSRISIE